MKINQPHTNIVCHVPRYGSTAPSPEVLEAARKLLEKKGVVLKENEGVETYSSVGEAIGNASDWNSMLFTARSSRGPQWDVASQQFLVDKESHLYYDHAALAPTDGETNNDQPTPLTGHTPNALGMTPPGSHMHTPTAGTFGELTLPQHYPHQMTGTPSPVPSRYDFPQSEGRRTSSRSTRGNPGGGMY